MNQKASTSRLTVTTFLRSDESLLTSRQAPVDERSGYGLLYPPVPVRGNGLGISPKSRALVLKSRCVEDQSTSSNE